MKNTVKLRQDIPPSRRRRRLRQIAMLPTLMTLGNLVCGFAAIHFALRAMLAAGAGVDRPMSVPLDSQLVERMLPSFLSIGAMLVFIGMFFDMLDGAVARLTKKVSPFGVQIDSLADIVTFGVAPAVLFVALMLREWRGEHVMVTPLSEQATGRAMWVCAAVYCMCAAVRLARFNVEQGRVEFSHRRFRGLPSPAAAAVMASLITLHEHSVPQVAVVALMALPIVSLITGLLMISRVPYPHVAEVYLFRRRPFEHLLVFVVVFVIFWSYKVQTLAVLCGLYALSGPALSLTTRWRSQGWTGRPVDDAEAETQEQKTA